MVSVSLSQERGRERIRNSPLKGEDEADDKGDGEKEEFRRRLVLLHGGTADEDLSRPVTETTRTSSFISSSWQRQRRRWGRRADLFQSLCRSVPPDVVET